MGIVGAVVCVWGLCPHNIPVHLTMLGRTSQKNTNRALWAMTEMRIQCPFCEIGLHLLGGAL